jgi:geranylgeranyl pyrophosphate synthase
LAYRTAALAPRNVPQIVQELGEQGLGVVRGQVEDIEQGDKDIEFVYIHKTADLFIAAAAMGALAAGAPPEDVAKLREFALNLGLAFQYEDDLLDGDSPYGMEKTQSLAQEATAKAISSLDGLSGDTTELRLLAQSLLGRKK